jgi:hypothetical protein
MANPHYDLERSIRYLAMAADAGHSDSRTLLQQQLAKRKEVRQSTVVDDHSPHAEALKKLSLQEGKAIVTASVVDEGGNGPSASDASSPALVASLGKCSTPSQESLFLALARLHSRYPDFGCARLHQLLKSEYQSWIVSEKRVKAVMHAQGWTPASRVDGAGAANAAYAAALAAAAIPSPETLLAEQQGKIRINDKVILNDLD